MTTDMDAWLNATIVLPIEICFHMLPIKACYLLLSILLFIKHVST